MVAVPAASPRQDEFLIQIRVLWLWYVGDKQKLLPLFMFMSLVLLLKFVIQRNKIQVAAQILRLIGPVNSSGTLKIAC